MPADIGAAAARERARLPPPLPPHGAATWRLDDVARPHADGPPQRRCGHAPAATRPLRPREASRTTQSPRFARTLVDERQEVVAVSTCGDPGHDREAAGLDGVGKQVGGEVAALAALRRLELLLERRHVLGELVDRRPDVVRPAP